MSPIHDPRFSKAQWDKSRAAEEDQSRHNDRAEHIKALGLMGVAIPVGFLLTLRALPGGFAAAAGGYLLWLALAIAAGTAGLLISAKLFLGEAGPPGLSILRIAAMVTVAEAVYVLLGGGRGAGLAAIGVYAVLAAWLFDMDLQDAALCGAITLVLVVAVSMFLATLLPVA